MSIESRALDDRVIGGGGHIGNITSWLKIC